MTGAVILAAGYSSRMGAFKPLLEVGGLSVLARVIRCLRAGGADIVCVVTGHNRELLKNIISGEGAAEIFNPDYNDGMFTSVRAGVRYFADKNTDGILLTPADYPLIPSIAVKKLLAAANNNVNKFAVPVFKGAKGHPLYIPSRFYGEILAHDGTGGLKGVTQRCESEVLRVDMPYEGVMLDMDELSDYKNIMSSININLTQISKGRRFILLRHGDTQRHADRVFIGQYDVALSQEGILQAERAAEELAGLKLSAKAVYCGSLIRVKATAEIIAGRLKLPVCILPGLNEMSLGAWDGRMIEVIKKEYPAEYQRRGDDLLKYKFDADAENFYDLQYRTADCLTKILSEDDSRDIIIASHSGVIKCLFGSLNGHDIDWAYSRCKPNKGEYIVINESHL
jgi:CTP:molybdopterin cytidylyltransferase MocA/broad specificity phosphatase PhoE